MQSDQLFYFLERKGPNLKLLLYFSSSFHLKEMLKIINGIIMLVVYFQEGYGVVFCSYKLQ